MNAATLEAEIVELKAAVEADGVNGTNEDDPRIDRVGQILTILESFFWDDYKRIVIEHFNVPANHFDE
jgi:hypothetical protein